jgi:hypothetical protein
MIRPYLLVFLLLAACNTGSTSGTDAVANDTLAPSVVDTVPNDGTSIDTSTAAVTEQAESTQPTESKVVKDITQAKQEPAKQQSQNPLESKITGTWQWSYTSCCNRRPVITKDSSARKTLLKFSNGAVQYYHDKELQSKDTYKISENNKGVPQIKFAEKNYPAYLSFKGDTMVISYGYMDLQTEYYIRK